MGRKRLLTILATVAAAVTLQAGPASAQLLNDSVNLGSDEGCLEVGVDISLSEALKLDSSACLTEDGVEVEGGSETLKKQVDTKKATDTVKDTTSRVTDAAKKESPAPAPVEDDPATKPGGSDAPGAGSGSNDAGSTDGGDTGSDVAASGEVREPAAADPARQRHLGTLLAIRDDLAAGSPVDRGIAGPVRPFGDLMSTDDLAAPQVADAAGVEPGVESPNVASAATDDAAAEEAVLASTTPMRDLAEAPLALQLLAAALVLGAAAVWAIAAREFGLKGQTTTSV